MTTATASVLVGIMMGFAVLLIVLGLYKDDGVVIACAGAVSASAIPLALSKPRERGCCGRRCRGTSDDEMVMLAVAATTATTVTSAASH